ncbi:MAG: hypothetical protein ACOYL6_15450 [Bacteriovoracaceae bacterium]
MKALILSLVTLFSIGAMAQDYTKFPGVKMDDSRLFLSSFTEFPDLPMVRATVLINGVDAEKIYSELGKVIGTKAEEEIDGNEINRRTLDNSLSCWKKEEKYNCSVFVGF